MLSRTAELTLININKNLKYKKRTWYDTPRDLDIKMLSWQGKVIGISRLDDVRGELKNSSYVKRWHKQRPRNSEGQYQGSYANGQLTLKGCYYLRSRGNEVYRPAWGVAKKYHNPKKPETATRDKVPEPKEKIPSGASAPTFFIDPYQDLPPPSGPLTHEEIVEWMKKDR